MAILFTDFSNRTFYFRCFVQNASFATLMYKVNTRERIIQRDDPHDGLSTSSMQKTLNTWISEQQLHIQDIITAIEAIRTTLHDDRLIAQLINHSLKEPTWYTAEYWQGLPSLLTFFHNLDDLKASPLTEASEITIVLS